MELYSILYGSLDGKEIWKKMNTLCMAESLCCSFETITTLLISYTLPQYKLKSFLKSGNSLRVGIKKNSLSSKLIVIKYESINTILSQISSEIDLYSKILSNFK